MTETIPVRNEVLAAVELWNDVMIPQQHAIEGLRRGDKLLAVLGVNDPIDELVDGGILDPGVVLRAWLIGRLAAPEASLLVSRRKRFRPHRDRHVEVAVAQPVDLL